MHRSVSFRSCAPGFLLAALLLPACGEPPLGAAGPAPAAYALYARDEAGQALAQLRRATAAYHDIEAALADDFVLLHGCEARPGEGQVGAVYIRPDRLGLGIDPSRPQGLLYEPDADGRMRLLGAELAIPYPLWTDEEPPEFLGAQFQQEDEFGVWALHVWLWRHNPEGMFAQAHPGVDCEEHVE